jgi:RNA polymerase sigma-70 factor (ECF subfamily)
MEVDDSALVARVQAGEAPPFRELVFRHSAQLFRVAYRITGNEQDAEDVVQETFLRAHRTLSSFGARSSFSTWLTRIAANCARDHVRSRRRRTAALGNAPVPEGGSRASTGSDPESQVFNAQLNRIVERTLQDMGEQERIAFTLRHFEEMNSEEIGEILSVSGNAIRQSIFRAVSKLRAVLSPLLNQRGSIP